MVNNQYAPSSNGNPQPQDVQRRPGASEEHLQDIREHLAGVRTLFSEISRAPDQVARQRILVKICFEVASIKTRLGAAEVLPAWKMAMGLEGLLTELAANPSNINLSNLRTSAGALVTLEALCAREVRNDLVTNPSIRFLIVDDDPICRRAVSQALKKFTELLDVAENGDIALDYAARQAYDAIFLDVEMPGKNGFEVCSGIHLTEANRTTPVVFVTSHSDFESRSKSTDSGGKDLIAKPFHSYEITVKALTLVLRHRLEEGKPGQKREVRGPAAPAVKPAPVVSIAPATAPAPRQNGLELLEGPPVPLSPEARKLAEAFAAQAPERLRAMRAQLASLNPTREPASQEELLGDVSAGLREFIFDAEQAQLKLVHHLASAAGILVRKFQERPALCTVPVLESLQAALRLLEDLCGSATAPSDAPIRAMVVDDNPVSRRTISNALQSLFATPEQAVSGKAALALALDTAFDVIFLDVLMPDMDGFSACSNIRQTSLNSKTPVIFVTWQLDGQSLEKSARCGGDGFVLKPILAAGTYLSALTFALRHRMSADNRPRLVGKQPGASARG